MSRYSSYILLIREPDVEISFPYSWNILIWVEKTLPYSWNILQYVTKTLGYSWDILGWLNKTLACSWNILGWLDKKLAYSWGIFDRFIDSKTVRTFISRPRSKEFTPNGIRGTSWKEPTQKE